MISSCAPCRIGPSCSQQQWDHHRPRPPSSSSPIRLPHRIGAVRFRSARIGFNRQRCIAVRADKNRDRGLGDSESKEVLDAFFLGKAFAEALTERLGTAVGEFLSDIGRWQAEQQKQARNFQEEVQERAKKAQLKAAREALGSDQPKVQIRTSYNGTAASSSGSYDSPATATMQSPRSTPDSQDL